jgi:cell wall-associated NlpC family hydrolase
MLIPMAAVCIVLAGVAVAGLRAADPGVRVPASAVGAEAMGLNPRPVAGTGSAALQVTVGQLAGRRIGGTVARQPGRELAVRRAGTPVAQLRQLLRATRARVTAVRHVLGVLRRLRSGNVLGARSASERRLRDSLEHRLGQLAAQVTRLKNDLAAQARPQLTDRATLMAAAPSRSADHGPAPAPAPSPAAGGQQAGRATAVGYAEAQLGKPYVWGGAGPYGFDCSGLVMMAWHAAGISLPHYTVSQWDDTYHISVGQLQPGDLVFSNGFGHVQMYVGHGEVVQAPHTGAVVSYAPLPPAGDVDGYASVLRAVASVPSPGPAAPSAVAPSPAKARG